MRTPDELTELFRSTGRKVTAQRQCIFRLLQGNETHPSAEAIHAEASREMETISLKTVYQTLHDLAELGEIASLDVGTGMTRFDPNVDHPHHHLVCRSCGRVRDLVADFPDLQIPKGADLGFDRRLGGDRLPRAVPRVPARRYAVGTGPPPSSASLSPSH